MTYSTEVIEALATLRTGARGGYRVQPEVRAAIKTMDKAGVFREIDEQQPDYATTDPGVEQHGNTTESDSGHEK